MDQPINTFQNPNLEQDQKAEQPNQSIMSQPQRKWPVWLTIVIVAVIVAAIAGAGWWYWNKNYAIGPTPTPTATPDETANWQIFTSKLLNFSFKYPPIANYQEKDVFEGRATTHTGKEVYFSDKNSQSPDFDVITNNFTAEDSVVHDFVQGSLSTGNFTLITFDEKHQKKRQVASGMYEVVAYGNLECSPTIASYLIVSPPKGSDLKYESFNLYSTQSISEFSQDDMDSNSSDPYCTPKESAINSKIDYLFSQKDPVLEKSLNTAIEIASTFQINQTVDTSTWKTYTNTQYGFEFKYPPTFSLKSSEDNCSDPKISALECHGYEIFLSSNAPLSIKLGIDEPGSAVITGDSTFDFNRLKEDIIRSRSIVPNSNGVKIYKHSQPTFLYQAGVRYSLNKDGFDFFEFDPSDPQFHEFDWYIQNNDYAKITEQILSTFKFTK